MYSECQGCIWREEKGDIHTHTYVSFFHVIIDQTVYGYQCRGRGRRGLTFWFLLHVSNC